MSKWISVTDHLPKAEGSYMVATKNGGVMIAHFYPNGSGGTFTDAKVHATVTDWTEKPVHPTKQVKTNADVVREMTDDELVDFLHRVSTFPCEACCNNSRWCRRNNAPEPVCERHYKDWLKEEAK